MSGKPDQSKTGISPAKLVSMYKCMNDLRLQNIFCDVTIKVKDKEIHAHGGVLCAHSHYFKDLLKKCNIGGEKVLVLEKLEPEIVRSCIDFMYTGEVELNDDNLDEITEAAHLFGLKEIEKMSAKIFIKDMDVYNGMAIRRVGRRYHWDDIVEQTERFLKSNCIKVLMTDVFVIYSKDELVWLLDNKQLSHPLEEMQIWASIIKWTEHHMDQREPYLFELLQKITLDNLSVAFMNDSIRREPMVMRSQECMKYLLQHLFARISNSSGPDAQLREKIMNEMNH
uniref:kelch-like protein 7 n=1 Tax=Styela clava TaxID=7725 RepID=UPI00193AD680|nr:kelch-like protein 7 [Styela clava]